MPISAADVVLIAPDLATFNRASLDEIIVDVYNQLSTDAWGTRRDLGAKYLAAHVATIVRRGGEGAGGPVVEERVGEVARRYITQIDHPLLDSTPYGKEYRRLMRGLVNTRVPFVLGGPDSFGWGGLGRGL